MRLSTTRLALWSQRGSAPGSVISTLARRPNPVRRLSASRSLNPARSVSDSAGDGSTHQDVVEARVAPEHDRELIDLRVGPHELLDPARVDDDAPDLLHVVEAGEHAALEGDQGAPAGALAVGHLDDVARPVADEGHGLSVEAGQDQLAAPAGTDGPVLLVQHLWIAVVLVDVRQARPRVALEAPCRDLREAGQVVGLGPEGRLDPGPGRGDGGAGLSRVPRDADLGVLREVDTLLRRLLRQEEGVGWRAAEHGDRIGEEFDLTEHPEGNPQL